MADGDADTRLPLALGDFFAAVFFFLGVEADFLGVEARRVVAADLAVGVVDLLVFDVLETERCAEAEGARDAEVWVPPTAADRLAEERCAPRLS